tara:strand:+ start:282 stop:2963 length:2682 start_codon:yes stop_codon:yes gene_type:complete
MEIDKRPAWLSRAMNKNTPTKNGATVRTSSEYDADLKGEVIYPTLRMGKDGKLRKSDINEALDKNDYILIKGPPNKETADKATAKSKQISKQIGIARQMKQGGTMAKKAQQGLGILPMTKKQSNPTGNKNQPAQKIPQRGAAPKVADPRDEAIKLVSKKYEQDKKQGGVSPMTMMPLVPQPLQPMPTEMVPPEQQPTPMKKGGMKDKKGLAVVIDMQPSYEEASKGTPADPPPGATADEVRDDQHVLLSEGELVVPANVVRYHGLGMYEGLRREALQGLSEMEQSGQVDYVDDNEPKKAQAGLALASGTGPSVATTTGIAQQQRMYNPALGMYGTATTPQAASAKFIRSPGFVDRNKDGIEDRLQPSINTSQTTGFVPAGNITPAGLALGPVTNPNLVVGAGNVGTFRQSQKPVSDITQSDQQVKETPVAPTRIAQQNQSTVSGSDDNNEMADLGGARTTIGGVDYAIQYDFQGNVIGLANVAEYNRTGQVNFFEPSNEVKGLIGIQNEGQRALMRSPIQKGAEALGFLKGDPEAIERGKDATTTLNNFTGNLTKTEEMATADEEAAAADIMGAGTPRVDAPKVKSDDLIDLITDAQKGPALSKEERDRQREERAKLVFDREDLALKERRSQRESPEDIIVPTEKQEPRNQYGQTREEEERGVQLGLSRGFNPETVAPGTATNAALTGKGYSSYDAKGNPTGAAPKGSQFSATGTFRTSRSDDDDGGVGTSGDLGGATGAGRTGEGTEGVEGVGGKQTAKETTVDPTKGKDLSRTFADDAATSDTGKIVCTEMYRQTQLDDWAQAMKIWYVYQRKYLTSTHQIGYHWLFKPFVSGMKVNNVLTNIGAYFAKERTKHLRHILTKGKAKDSIVGNIFCKIIHPIVYLAGCAIRKK